MYNKQQLEFRDPPFEISLERLNLNQAVTRATIREVDVLKLSLIFRILLQTQKYLFEDEVYHKHLARFIKPNWAVEGRYLWIRLINDFKFSRPFQVWDQKFSFLIIRSSSLIFKI